MLSQESFNFGYIVYMTTIMLTNFCAIMTNHLCYHILALTAKSQQIHDTIFQMNENINLSRLVLVCHVHTSFTF